jgi:hypothetical protein
MAGGEGREDRVSEFGDFHEKTPRKAPGESKPSNCHLADVPKTSPPATIILEGQLSLHHPEGVLC